MLGNSGCTIKFDHDKNIVIKSATNYPVDRLYKQYSKSKHFKCNNPNIKSPIIKGWMTNGSFKMDTVNGYNFIEFAKTHTLEELKKISDILFEFVKNEFLASDQFITVNNHLLEKMNLIKRFLDPHDYNIIVNLIELEKIHFPIGNCHGDLTFSNMMFFDDSIYLLDFLDSFIDSPVMDITKLQQDTIYKWSLFLTGTKYKKVDEWFQYTNDLLKFFGKESWYNKPILHVINLARILPYSQKNDRMLGYLYSCIQQTLSYCQSAASQQDSLVLDLNGF